MQFTLIATIFAAVSVSALPQLNGDAGTRSSAIESCAADHKTSCCDASSASEGFLSNILGGACSITNFNVPVLAVGGLSGPQCNNGNTFCCPTLQDVSRTKPSLMNRRENRILI
jgi:hypothetical protein